MLRYEVYAQKLVCPYCFPGVCTRADLKHRHVCSTRTQTTCYTGGLRVRGGEGSQEEPRGQYFRQQALLLNIYPTPVNSIARMCSPCWFECDKFEVRAFAITSLGEHDHFELIIGINGDMFMTCVALSSSKSGKQTYVESMFALWRFAGLKPFFEQTPPWPSTLDFCHHGPSLSQA